MTEMEIAAETMMQMMVNLKSKLDHQQAFVRTSSSQFYLHYRNARSFLFLREAFVPTQGPVVLAYKQKCASKPFSTSLFPQTFLLQKWKESYCISIRIVFFVLRVRRLMADQPRLYPAQSQPKYSQRSHTNYYQSKRKCAKRTNFKPIADTPVASFFFLLPVCTGML